MSTPRLANADAMELFNQGYSKFVNEDFSAAIQLFNEAISVGGTSDERLAYIHHHRGAAYSRLGSYQSAIDSFDQALKLKPDLKISFRERGNALSYTGQYQLAVSDYDRSLFFLTEDADALHNRGYAHAQLGEPSKAIQDYSAAIKIDPESAISLYNRGLAWYEIGDFNQTVNDCNATIAIEPDHIPAFNTRGKAYFQLNMLPLALASFEKAIKLDPKNAEAFYNHGFAQASSGEFALAIESYDRALSIQPGQSSIVASRIEAVQALQTASLSNLTQADEMSDTLQTAPESIASADRITNSAEPETSHDKSDSSKAMAPANRLPEPSYDIELLKQRGWESIQNSEFAQAAQDFERILSLNPDDQYRLLALYVAEGNSGGQSLDKIKPYADRSQSNDWPRPIVQFLVGEIDQQQLLNKLGNIDDQPERWCELSYYLAEHFLIKGDLLAAQKWFENATQTGIRHFNEHKVSLLRLQQIADRGIELQAEQPLIVAEDRSDELPTVAQPMPTSDTTTNAEETQTASDNADSSEAAVVISEPTEARLVLPSNDVELLKRRGWLAMQNSEFAQAAQDFERILSLNPDDQYRMLALYVAEGSSGGQPLDKIKPYAGRSQSNDWPRPMVRFLIGEIDQQQLLGAVGSIDEQPERWCELSYYLGEYFLIKEEFLVAQKWFENATQPGVKHFNENKVSVLRLQEIADRSNEIQAGQPLIVADDESDEFRTVTETAVSASPTTIREEIKTSPENNDSNQASAMVSQPAEPSSDLELLKRRGWLSMQNSEFEQAADDFERMLSLNPDDQYRMLALYVAEGSRGGQPLEKIKPYADRNRSNDWPRPIVQFLVGEIDQQRLLNQVGDIDDQSERWCELSYYLAEYFLIKEDLVTAQKWFENATQFGVEHFNEHKVSVLRLEQIANHNLTQR